MKVTNTRKIIIISILVILFFSIVGVTYSYIRGNNIAGSGEDVVINTARLGLVFTDGTEINIENMLPGKTFSKTFTVKNNSQEKVVYELFFKDFLNTFLYDELVFSLTGTNGGAAFTEKPIPIYNNEESITNGIEIEPGVTHTYKMDFKFKEIGTSQNYNLGATLKGVLQIRESVSSMRLYVSGNPNTWTNNDVILSLTSNFSSIVEYMFDGSWSTNNTSPTYSSNQTVKVGIRTNLGATIEEDVIISKIDKVAPTKASFEVRENNSEGNIHNNGVSSKPLWIGNFASTDALSGVDRYEYSEGCTGNAMGVTVEGTVFENKSTSMCIRAVDKAGNKGPWSDDIYIRVETSLPIIQAKESGTASIEPGTNNDILNTYFTYSQNGSVDITEKTCIDRSNKSAVVTNTSLLTSGNHNIRCTVKKSNGLSAYADKTIFVSSGVGELSLGAYVSYPCSTCGTSKWRIAYTSGGYPYITSTASLQTVNAHYADINLNTYASGYCESNLVAKCGDIRQFAGTDFSQTIKQWNGVTTTLDACSYYDTNALCGSNNPIISAGTYTINEVGSESQLTSSHSYIYQYKNGLTWESYAWRNPTGSHRASLNYYIRPVVRLKSTLKVIGGSGTEADPYILSN